MGTERAWLLYPIGDVDVDPEEVISFYGILPQSTSKRPDLRKRGLVTIVFFGLDDTFRRKQLMKERAVLIVCLYPQLQKAQHSTEEEARTFVDRSCEETEPHANCARSFVRLFRSDQAAADGVAAAACKYYVSGSL